MGRYAFETLPAWQQEFWKGLGEQIARNCLVPDEYFTQKEKYGKYCVMDNGQVIPHGPTDDNWTGLPFVQRPSRGPHQYTIRYYLDRLVQSIGDEQRTDSAIFAGVLGHFLQDSSQPAHLIHNDWLYQLVAPPDGCHLHLHREMDSADPEEVALKEICPCLLGTTVFEAAFHLRAQYERMIEASLAQVVPLVQAAYAGDKAAATRAITQPYATATWLTASAWHTAHCIAAGRFDEEQRQALSAICLSSVPHTSAISMDPYAFRPLMDAATDGQGRTVTLRLNVKSADGSVRETSFENGIAMSWGNVIWDIPGSLYREFQATIGLLNGVADDAKASFKAVLDGGPVVYEAGEKAIADYGGPIVFDSGIITGADPSRQAVIPLGAASRLTLIVECPEANTHAIWAAPRLVK